MTLKLPALEKSRLFMEEYSGKILLATMGRSRNVYELSEKLGIPIAVCYRKIRLLENLGMIYSPERKLTQNGKWVNLYKSKVKTAYVVFQNNQIKAKIEMIDGTTDDETFDIKLSAFTEIVGKNRNQ